MAHYFEQENIGISNVNTYDRTKENIKVYSFLALLSLPETLVQEEFNIPVRKPFTFLVRLFTFILKCIRKFGN